MIDVCFMIVLYCLLRCIVLFVWVYCVESSGSVVVYGVCIDV
jgi:hypothetical protein